eukprot:1182261-Prorocentrum_minimum.AAC.1
MLALTTLAHTHTHTHLRLYTAPRLKARAAVGWETHIAAAAGPPAPRKRTFKRVTKVPLQPRGLNPDWSVSAARSTSARQLSFDVRIGSPLLGAAGGGDGLAALMPTSEANRSAFPGPPASSLLLRPAGPAPGPTF